MRNEDFEAGKASAQGVSPSNLFGTKWVMTGGPSGVTAISSNPIGGETHAFAGKKNVGKLIELRDKVHNIRVNTDYQRKGVATQLLRTANFERGRQGNSGPIGHGEIRTPSGDAWAKAVGGELPPKVPSFHAGNIHWEDIK
jgi:hypothetical protein